MKLIKVRVRQFQSIIDSEEFEIDDLTCLVGKNESGKTAILKAMYYLNPVVPQHGFSPEVDYPRKSYTEFLNLRDKKSDEHVIEAEFIFEKNDTKILKTKFGGGLNYNKNTRVRVSKNYNNELSYLNLDINEKNVLKHLVGQIVADEVILNEIISQDIASIPSYIQQNYSSLPLSESDENENRIGSILEILREMQIEGIHKFVEKEIHKLIPKFMYFDEYHNIKGEENLDGLLDRRENGNLTFSDYTLIGLFELAGLTIENLLNPSTTEEMFNRLEVAANIVSDKVFEYWSQNTDIELKFERQPGTSNDPPGLNSGMNIFGRVFDKRYGVSTSLSNRSRGFLWFFSFSALYQKLCNDYDGLILLLDEPGLSLHASAQADLLNFFEDKLKTNHQIIYTTHSPFMINPSKFERIRIVLNNSMEKESLQEIDGDGGTKITLDVGKVGRDTIFPLQGALGYDITQSLFVGPNCLIVEGLSDWHYLDCLSVYLQEKGEVGLSADWTITPVGGLGNVSTFVSLLGSQDGLNIAVLLDYRKINKQKIDNLYKKNLLKKNNLILYSDYIEEIKEADIEDMFDFGFYVELLNDTFGTSIKIQDLQHEGKPIISRLDYLAKKDREVRSQLSYNGNSFNHNRPAKYFASNFDKIKARLNDTELDRFRKLFDSINSLL